MVPRIDQGNSLGSGIIFQVEPGDSGGIGAFILTNAHVVNGFGPITASVWDNTSWGSFTLNASVVGRDDEADVAIVWACCDSRLEDREMSFGAADIGAEVIILGHPYGRDLGYPSGTAGIISSQAVTGDTEQEIYLTDAPANPGNSGGPLILRENFEFGKFGIIGEAGDVVGIITSKNVGLAIEGQATAIDIYGIADLVQELCSNRCRIPY